MSTVLQALAKTFFIGVSGDCELSIKERRIAYGVSASFSKGKKALTVLSFKSKNRDQSVGILDLVRFFDSGNSLREDNIPGFIKNTTISSFRIAYSAGETNEFEISFGAKIQISEGNELDIEVSYNSRSGEATGSQLTAFKGKLYLNNTYKFNLAILLSGSGNDKTTHLLATYDQVGKTTLDFTAIAKNLFSASDVERLPDLSITLDDIKAFFLYSKKENAATSRLCFGLGAGIGAELGLKDLPLAGSLLPVGDDASLAIENILVLYSNGSFSLEEITNLSVADILPQQAIGKGINIISKIKVGGIAQEYALSDITDYKPAKAQNPDAGIVPEKADAVISGKGDKSTKWVDVNKKLGPLSLQRIGFSYQAGKVVFLLDATMNIAAISLQLAGLGFGFKLKWMPDLPPDFYLEGLGISYQSGPVSISGMFIKMPQKNKDTIEFYGAASVRLSKFSIAGVGAYSQTKTYNQATQSYSIESSFFIYAVFSGPIGGPAFFFITGLAAGFGYNRKARIPKLEEVRDFPLVAMALNPNSDQGINKILKDLIDQNWIPVSAGDYWLAVGIKFSSFQIVESFVLLIVQFGTRLEFALIGLSILKWPQEGITIAYIELAILARFGEGSDVISVEAMITSNSYVFDRNCKISGGFAFYSWISGEHEGDFVITLGGYHPEFKKPAHYPVVDRLQLRWKISNIISIYGELYYALTPNAIMAGGRWELMCDLSFLKASVMVWANMLLAWAPVHYQIDAGIIVRIEANIKILFVYIYFKVEISAKVKIWGPPFSGHIYVDWSIFSFTIGFGAGKEDTVKLLDWKAFESSYVPKKGNTYQPIDVRMVAGVMSVLKDNDGKLLATFVNPYDLAINVDSFFPIREFNTENDPITKDTIMEISGTDTPILKNAQNVDFGIRPMGITALNSKLTLTLEKDRVSLREGFNNILNAKGMPGALWSADPSTGNNDDPLIKNIVTGLQIHTREMVEGKQGTIDLSELDKELLAANIQYLTNANAGNVPDGPDSVKKIIAKGIELHPTAKTAFLFKDTELYLPLSDKVTYDDYDIDTPKFIASIGQKIPAKRSS